MFRPAFGWRSSKLIGRLSASSSTRSRHSSYPSISLNRRIRSPSPRNDRASCTSRGASMMFCVNRFSSLRNSVYVSRLSSPRLTRSKNCRSSTVMSGEAERDGMTWGGSGGARVACGRFRGES
jgi:hypothetical protein